MSLTAEKLLVGLSRVERLDHLRILPYGPGQNEQHLYSLKPNQLMLHWFARFNESGVWSPQGSAASVQKHPLTYSKKRASTASTTRQNSNKPSVQPEMSNQASDQNSVRVVSQYRLNLAHAWRGDTDRLFHAFHVPGDGHCLFHSYILFLKIPTTVSGVLEIDDDDIDLDAIIIAIMTLMNVGYSFYANAHVLPHDYLCLDRPNDLIQSHPDEA
jgi:hypothetical protein